MAIPALRSRKIKELAATCGFDACGISRSERLDSEEDHLANWLGKGYHGTMHYMENHFEKRLDPRKLVPGSRSVVSLLFNYFPHKELQGDVKISKYAYGEDYHRVLKDRMQLLLERMQEEFGPISGRAFVDSAPVLERAWAARSGLGWIGKHSLLLRKGAGSFYFIAQLIIDLDLDPDSPATQHCGSCTACIDACPTGAIVGDGIVDSNRCISYLTIELKEEIPKTQRDQLNGWVFGCDICQDVCPWNRFAKEHREPRFAPHAQLEEFLSTDWQEISQDIFRDIFKKSAVKRAGFPKLRHSISIIGDDRSKH